MQALRLGYQARFRVILGLTMRRFEHGIQFQELDRLAYPELGCIGFRSEPTLIEPRDKIDAEAPRRKGASPCSRLRHRNDAAGLSESTGLETGYSARGPARGPQGTDHRSEPWARRRGRPCIRR